MGQVVRDFGFAPWPNQRDLSGSRMTMTDDDRESGASDSDHAALIEAEKIRTHYRNMPTAFVGVAVVASVLAYILADTVRTDWVMGWLGAVYLLSVSRFILWRRYQRAQPSPGDAGRWGLYASVVYGTSGVLWGFGNLLLYPAGNLTYQLFLLFVTMGVGLGASYGLISYLPAFYAFIVPAISLAVVPFFRDGDAMHVSLGALMGFYLLVTIRFVQHHHRSYVESLHFRFQNIDLVEDLRRQKESAEQARRAAEDANVAKSRFLAAASHDLRQPLQAMSLFVQTLEESDLPGAERAMLVNVRRSIDAMEELFGTLLDVSRLDAGVVSVNPSTVPLQPIVERVRAQFEPVAQEKGLRFRLRCTSAYVRTDPMLLERVLRNLVANAVQHTPCGDVLLACRRRGASVRLEVWDTGPGIPADQHQAIFREFMQLGNPERDRRKGLGLGLAIVDRLCRLLRHPLDLRSRVGRGSVFALAVPRGEHRDYRPQAAIAETGAMLDLAGRLVLVIDDEIAVRDGMSALFGKWGCEVIATGSATEMQERIAGIARKPSLLICDYRLRDGENGIQVVERLRHEFNAEIPALLITGDTGPERLRDAEASGLPILHKPVNPARLRTLMAAVLNVAGNRE